MNTRKYDAATRKAIKHEQRGPAYRELQERTKRDREALEAKLARREKPLREAINEARVAIGRFRQAVKDYGGVVPEKLAEPYDDLLQAYNKLLSMAAPPEVKPA